MSHELKRFLFVVNPISGGRDKSTFLQHLPQWAQNHNYELHIYKTTGNNDRQSIEETIKKEKPQVVVAVGGDGTCKLVAESLQGSDAVLGIIPFGSANGLATSLRIPTDPQAALQALPQMQVYKLDALYVNKSLTLHLADIGFNAKVIHRFQEEEVRGWWGYFKLYLQERRSLTPFKIRFHLPHAQERKWFSKKAYILVIANMQRYGTGALINPVGRANDGKFELVLIRPIQWWRLLLALPLFFSDRHLQRGLSKIWQTDYAELYLKKAEELQVDGEPMGKHKKVVVRLKKQAIPILCPQEQTNNGFSLFS
ncbi:diacylglycerol/lipid kinase family protein [Thermonema rossianum]|uniref:diacylglycerol/lipid kinase family protein n=1 Tax=Thermonema rossianum TaxID=55505 RepID=UPI000691BCA2|nr:diacylglycerol kinase family protein [Thermonema rossianum]